MSHSSRLSNLRVAMEILEVLVSWYEVTWGLVTGVWSESSLVRTVFSECALCLIHCSSLLRNRKWKDNRRRKKKTKLFISNNNRWLKKSVFFFFLILFLLKQRGRQECIFVLCFVCWILEFLKECPYFSRRREVDCTLQVFRGRDVGVLGGWRWGW